MPIASNIAQPPVGNADDAEYYAYLSRVQSRFRVAIGDGSVPLFTTDAADLFPAYLAAFPPAEQQHHNCNSCRRFIQRFGALVTIDDAGRTTSTLWNVDDAPAEYRAPIEAMLRIVRRAAVTGVFRSRDTTWGSPLTGCWRHLSVTPPPALLMRRGFDTPHQAMAEKLQEFQIVERALQEYPVAVVETAVTLLQSDAMYRNEKVLGPATWLRDVHQTCAAAHASNRTNLLWRAVATAPAGFCHPRSSMIGTLLDDIVAGLPFADVAARFAAKMHPLQYQRPQAPPSAGNIAQAEKLIQQYGAAGSLQRRFARLEEVEALWRPKAQQQGEAGGVFGHLKPKRSAAEPSISAPPTTITWDKFERTILPHADRIEFYAPASPDSYAALVTAVNADAPPILQWDTDDHRNPVSWYVWNGGSHASNFSLRANEYHDVSAVTLKPSMWGSDRNRYPHQGKGVLFLLAAARETRNAGIALFPEILKAEFRPVRSTLEAYSLGQKIEGMADSTACGILLGAGQNWTAKFRVTTGNQVAVYRLDRWD